MSAREGGRQQWHLTKDWPAGQRTIRARFAGWALDNQVPPVDLRSAKAEFRLGWEDAIREDFERERAQRCEEAREEARRKAKGGGAALEAFDVWWLDRGNASRHVGAAQTAFLLEWRDVAGDAEKPVTWRDWQEAARAAGADAQGRARPGERPEVWFGPWFAQSGAAQSARIPLRREFCMGWHAASRDADDPGSERI